MIKKESRRDLDAQQLPASATCMASHQNKLYFADSTPTLKICISSFRWVHSVTPSTRNFTVQCCGSDTSLRATFQIKWNYLFVCKTLNTAESPETSEKPCYTHPLAVLFFREATLSTRNVCMCIYSSSGLYVKSINIKTDEQNANICIQ